MPTPNWTRVVIALAALIWFALALALEAPVDATWLKPAGAVVSAVVLLLLAFDRWGWKLLPYWVTRRPNLHGTWRTELQFEWPPGTPPRSKPCFLTVRQTYSSVKVDMHFDISDSESRSAGLVTAEGRHYLWWSYWSEAKQYDRENPPQRGAAEMAISATPELRLEGRYWTERKTVGQLVALSRSTTLFDDFASASEAGV